jgi:uncharacterized phage-associated protein
MIYTKDTISKIGNAMIYLAQNIEYLSKTKLLKLLYLIEEHSVVVYKTPFFGIGFKVWKLGPVAEDIFIDLSGDNEQPQLFSGFIRTGKKNNTTVIVPVGDFCDDEFSDNEMDTLESIVKTYGKYGAEKLVEVTHRSTSLWDKAVKENGLEKHFETSNHTDLEIDFSKLLSGREAEFYKDAVKTKLLFNELKS